MYIREAADEDSTEVLEVERLAFGRDEEAELVGELLEDPTARPLLSLLAFEEDRATGHVLFTSARLIGSRSGVKAALLAPLAVVPDKQGLGIGGRLVREGLGRLASSGTSLVFVLGHPGYYSRFGFEPAGDLGFEAPHPVPAEDSDGWMVKFLTSAAARSAPVRVVCADAIMKPEYWIE